MQSHYSSNECYPLVTYNDIPTPQGCWKQYNQIRQRKYNIHLLMGLSTFTITFVYGLVNDLFYLNWEIPNKPATIDIYDK